MATIDDLDSRILDLIQAGFPLVPRPYDRVAEQAGTTPEDLIARIARLKSEGVIREISAIFHSSALGYQSALVALKVSESKLDVVGQEIAKHPGVSHCYSRDNAYNLWFTITVPPDGSIEAEIARLADREGVESRLILPALRTFKIGVFLPMAGGSPRPAPEAQQPARPGLTDQERVAIKALQTDLPLTQTPFANLAKDAGMTEPDLLDSANSFLSRGIMRRYAAVLRHTRAGYTANAMVCWRVPPQDVPKIGEALAANPSVSHCYERPASPDWPYSLYTMLHARTDAELAATIEDLSTAAGTREYTILRTLKEFRKTRVRYLK